jgi:uncharacterized protein (DUF488 family)
VTTELPTIFTVGYEKRSVDDLVSLLRAREVDRVVDVRLTPFSRRPGFSKTRLSAALADAGIDYEHAAGLGNPPEIRELYLCGNTQAGHRAFREHLDNGASAALSRLATTSAQAKVALLCLERDPQRCHRQVVAAALVEQTGGRRLVVHL